MTFEGDSLPNIPRDRYISLEIFSCRSTLVFVAQNYPRAGALVKFSCYKHSCVRTARKNFRQYICPFIQACYKVWQQLNISRMVSWKSLGFGMELRAFKFYSLQFFQFYTIICFRDTKLTRIFLNGNRG
jgi:hypothetical protein